MTTESRSKHTPGPWRARTEGTELNPDWIAVFNSTGKWALATANQSAGIDREEAKANARLIAAAPEMLDALENAVQTIERILKTIPYVVPVSVSSAPGRFRTIISRAKGAL